MTITRRQLLTTGASIGLGAIVLGLFGRRGAATSAGVAAKFEVTHTDAEWRALLTPAQFSVLREEGTERAGTSPLNAEHRVGIFACAGCALDLFSSKTKLESGTGWPSFWRPLSHAVGERSDSAFGMSRIEVHCSRCGGHLGHVFNDGPPPTGLRYCMNGVAMTFHATTA